MFKNTIVNTEFEFLLRIMGQFLFPAVEGHLCSTVCATVKVQLQKFPATWGSQVTLSHQYFSTLTCFYVLHFRISKGVS